jgi:hypothetical protein
VENQHLPRKVTKSLQTILHNPYKYWPQLITKKIREEFIYQGGAWFIIVGSGYPSVTYRSVTYAAVGYPLVTYGSVGKGTLSFRGVSDMSYLPHMSELPYYVHVWVGIGRFTLIRPFCPICPICLICLDCPSLSLLSQMSVVSVLSELP